jgi:hypothetical protein
MKKTAVFPLTLLLILLTTCQRTQTIAPTQAPAIAATAVATVAPTATTAPPTVTPTATASQTAVPTTLLNHPFADRTPFQSGLLPSEQAVLSQLPGATDYQMELTIEPGLTVVNGRQQIRYTNQEQVALTNLYFHLFPNILDGSITVTDVRVDDQPVTPALESGNSVLRVPLPAPLPPGGETAVSLTFHTTIPQSSGRNYGIFATIDGILALAHFYPMVAVYDDDGWNITPPSEGGDVTYGDISFFLVQITAPADQTIATSGVTVQQSSSGNTQTITVAAGPMRDFYLASSDQFVIHSDTTNGITINSYAPTGLDKGAELALETAVFAVQTYSNRFGPYPYSELDLVTTPTSALGVEYPGIIANAIRIYNNGDGTPNHNFLESTTAHEVGHQWFYGLIGNDQLDEPWLDESLTQYVTWLYYLDKYGEQGADGFYQSLEGRWESVDKAAVAIGLPVADYSPSDYSAIVYGRGPIFLRELAATVGEDTFARFLQSYYQQYRWGIATTAEFQQLLEQTCACDLSGEFAAVTGN